MGGAQFSDSLAATFAQLLSDEDDATRRIVACSVHELAALVGPQTALPLFKDTVLTLLADRAVAPTGIAPLPIASITSALAQPPSTATATSSSSIASSLFGGSGGGGAFGFGWSSALSAASASAFAAVSGGTSTSTGSVAGSSALSSLGIGGSAAAGSAGGPVADAVVANLPALLATFGASQHEQKVSAVSGLLFHQLLIG